MVGEKGGKTGRDRMGEERGEKGWLVICWVGEWDGEDERVL